MEGLGHLIRDTRKGRARLWGLLAALLVVWLIGAYGIFQYEVHHYGHASWTIALYHALQLFILHTPHWEDPLNPFLMFALFAAPVVMGFATIEALWRVFRRDLLVVLSRSWGDHIILCGLGAKGDQLLGCYRRRGDRVVVIERDETNPALRKCDQIGVPVVVGAAGDPLVLQQARAHSARQLVAMGGDDGANVEVAVRVMQLLSTNSRRGPALECYVQVSDLDLRTSFQRNKVLKTHGTPARVHFFDAYESMARMLLVEQPIDHDGIREDDPRNVHLIIVGCGRMGQALALKAAQLGHFANRNKLKVTVIDRCARRREDRFLFRFPAFKEICDATFIEDEAESSKVSDLLIRCCEDTSSVTSVILCIDSDTLNVSIALTLLPRLRRLGAQISVRLSDGSGLATLFHTSDVDPKVKSFVRPFGMIDGDRCESLFLDERLDRLAPAIHNDFVVKQTTATRTPETDRALWDWDILDDDYKDANRQQADHIPIKLRAIGCEAAPLSDPRPAVTEFEPHEVELLAEMEHARWNAERLLKGWTHGPRSKNDEARTNPHIVSWADLPENIRDYDFEAVKLIPSLLARENQKVCRRTAPS